MNFRRIVVKIIICFISVHAFIGNSPAQTKINGIKQFLKGHAAAFVIYDLQHQKYSYYNEKRCRERFLPASTFKIPNSLIGLESGVIPDENFVIKWDSVKYWNEDWNRDHTLASAVKYSAVPYFRELARRAGRTVMQKYLNLFNYGNRTIGDKTDSFWLDNSLKISAIEQVNFLNSFYNYELPVSRRNTDIVKKILTWETYKSSLLKFKTGTGEKENGVWIGWLVGYIERNGNVYLFAFNIEAGSFPEVSKLRTEASRAILKHLNLID